MSFLPPAEMPEEVATGSPSASRSRRFPDDQLLRLYGWTIHRRPRHGPPLWRRGNVTLSQPLALEALRRQQESADADAA